MRTALWETSAGALAALLNSGVPLTKADLYTITLTDGTVLRWTSGEVAITGNGHTWQVGPGLTRTQVTFTVGVQVDHMTISIVDNAGTSINGVPLLQFIRGGGLAGATVQVDKAFWTIGDTAPRGALLWFLGRVADITGDRYGMNVSVNSALELLNIKFPFNVYQAGCLNTLFDVNCQASKATYTQTGAASSAGDSRNVTFSVGTSLGQASGYFNLGIVTFTSGPNTGISRTIRQHVQGSPDTLSVVLPFPFAISPGDAFSITPGCDKKQATCTGKFNNLPHFRGQPYIPIPPTVT